MATASSLLVLTIICFSLTPVCSQCTTPGAACSGCHDVINCDMAVQTLPITLTSFPFAIANDFTLSNIVAPLTVTATTSFASFTSYNRTSIASYNIIKFSCVAALGSLVLAPGSFAGLEHYRNVRFTDCDLNLVDDLFVDFVNLTSLAIYGGTISAVSSNVFRGLAMDWTGVVGTGSINITADFPSGIVPTDFFGPVADSLTELRVTDNNWNNYHAQMLNNVTGLRLLDMSRTNNSWVPDPFFDNTPAISVIYLYGLNWNCECPENKWLFDWEVSSGVHIQSDFICQTPAAMKGKYMRKWKIESCDKPGIGFFLGTYWVGLYQIMLWVMTIIFMVLAIVALVLAKKALNTKPVGGALLKMGDKKKKEAGAKPASKPGPSVAPAAKAGPPKEGQPPPTYESGDEGGSNGAVVGATVVTAAVHSNPSEPRPSSGQARPSSGRPASAKAAAAESEGAAPPPAATQAFQEPGAAKVSGIDRFRKMAAKVRLQKKVVNTWGDE